MAIPSMTLPVTTARRMIVAVSVLAIASMSCNSSDPLLSPMAVVIRESGEDSQIGGATMRDVVTIMRRNLRVPVSFEELNYGSQPQVVTLTDAVAKLRERKNRKELQAQEQSRLELYEDQLRILERLRKIKADKNPTEDDQKFAVAYGPMFGTELSPDRRIVGLKKRVFKLDLSRRSLQEILKGIVEADPDYALEIEKFSSGPYIGIRAKQDETNDPLGWEIPERCGTPEKLADLFGKEGLLREVFKINGVYFPEDAPRERLERKSVFKSKDAGREFAVEHVLTTEEKIKELVDSRRIPRVPVELCVKGLTARKLLQKIVTSGGYGYYWTVWTDVYGNRLIDFGRTG